METTAWPVAVSGASTASIRPWAPLPTAWLSGATATVHSPSRASACAGVAPSGAPTATLTVPSGEAATGVVVPGARSVTALVPEASGTAATAAGS
ncbi:hypothetical protein SGLAM104S_07768 [Streptomyces glaucescens]